MSSACPDSLSNKIDSARTPGSLSITVEFTGGLELLFSSQRKHHVSLPLTDDDGQPSNMRFLIRYLCQKVMSGGGGRSRREMFVLEGGEVRPGILVLINDADWELEGEEKYQLQNGDGVLFVSTLHGG